MPARLRQVLPHTLMLAAAGFLYWAATRIDADTGGRIGPAAWPKAIIVFMGLLCVYEIVKRLIAGSSFAAKGLIADLNQNPATETGQEAEGAAPVNRRMLWWGIALIAAYVLLVPWLGFFAATILFLWVFPLAGGYWRPGLNAVVSLAGTFSLFFVFTKVAYISLPLGEGPFRAISFGVMAALGVR